MPEQNLFVNKGANSLGTFNLNPDDKLKLEGPDDDGNWHLSVEGAVVTGDVHEVSIGPGAASGVAKVFPPLTEAQAVSKAEEHGTGPDEKVPASQRKGASASERKAAGEALPADEGGAPGAPNTSGETPPESGGKAGTGFSGQVKP